MTVAQKLRQIVDEIRRAKNPDQVREAWALALRLLSRMPPGQVDQAEAERVAAAMEIEGLDAIVRGIESPGARGAAGTGSGAGSAGGTGPGSAGGVAGSSAAPPSPSAITDPAARAKLEHDMESAMRAFRKRIKLARLSDESTLGGRQLTSGKKSGIDAMMPPREFPAAVWIALAEAGRLKHVGEGFYSLPEE